MPALPRLTTRDRRRRLTIRHHVGPSHPARDPVEATRGVMVLHGTDAATVHLSVLARVPGSVPADVTEALHTHRHLVRLLGMRRTLYVVVVEDAPLVQAAAAGQIAALLWRGLAKDLSGGRVDPPLDEDAEQWLARLGRDVVALVTARGPLTGLEIAALEPRLRTRVSDAAGRSQALTSRVLTALGADGSLVRGRTRGGWTSSRHQWEPADLWFPDGWPEWDVAAARSELLRRYLERFGPVTTADLRWWTGWTLTQVRAALAGVAVEEVELDEGPGWVLTGDLAAPDEDPVPGAALLPALDPTPMGWKDRDWLFDLDRPTWTGRLYDRNGNIGPTLWWDGAIVGGWAVGPDGSIRTRLLTDIGAQGRAAVDAAADDLHRRLGGTVVVPSFRTPLERSLADGQEPPDRT